MTEAPPNRMTRMWVNQPSTLQPHHDLHGTHMLACADTDRTCRAYFLSGDVVSMQILREALSDGWPLRTRRARPTRVVPAQEGAAALDEVADRLRAARVAIADVLSMENARTPDHHADDDHIRKVVESVERKRRRLLLADAVAA